MVMVMTCTLAVVATAAAYELTAGGSIDRWWYLAYVRRYMTAPHLGFGEPFFDGSVVASRFTFNVWLSTLAVWGRQSGVDPIFLYERVCPLVLVPTALSAALYLGRALFRRRRTTWLLGLASVLFWLSGALFPVLTRIPEDKLLALVILAPVTTAAALTVLQRPGKANLVLLAAAAGAQASVHPLVYLLAAVPVFFATAWMTASRQTTVLPAAFVVGILVLGGLFPAVGGTAARGALRADGAELRHPDHPVTRVHLGRNRLLLRSDGSYLVTPRLLLHPLTLLALICIPLLWRRARMEQAYLLPATLAPPLVAFVPAIAGLAGTLVLPWMVYRVLWVIPYTALLAVGMDEATAPLARRGKKGLARIPPLVLIAVALPSIAIVLSQRSSPQRLALTTPATGPFRAAMTAVATLPADAVIAAAPEISERIPAFTARHVLAASDRASVMFAGSRRHGEQRLRMRAAWMAGVHEATAGDTTPTIADATHLLIEPDAVASRYCGRHLFENDGFDLCEVSAARPRVPESVELARLPAAGSAKELPAGAVSIDLGRGFVRGTETRCEPEPERKGDILLWPRSGPWSAAQAHTRCTLQATARPGGGIFRAHSVTIAAALGRAVEEFTIVAAGARNRVPVWSGHAQLRLRSGEQGALALPRGLVDTVSVTVVPDFLPFLKLETLALSVETVRPSRAPEPAGANKAADESGRRK